MMTREQKDRHNALRKQHRQEWAAAGLCSNCGKRPALPGRKVCAECRDKRRAINAKAYRSRAAEQRKTYHNRKAAGLCVRCGKPAGNGQTMCEDCKARVKLYRVGVFDD